MSVLTSLVVKAKPENAEELKGWFSQEADHTRAFEGCRRVTIHADLDDPTQLLVLGEWDSRQQHEAYVAWRSEKGDVGKFMEWLAAEPTAHYFDAASM